LEQGDVIFKVDGEALTERSGGLAKVIAGKKVGDTVKLTLWRDGEERDVLVTLTETK
jgi:serine protease Do